MAVCARGSALDLYAVFAGFFFNFSGEKNMGRAMFQGRAQMITN